jgi:hypothetical protein
MPAKAGKAEAATRALEIVIQITRVVIFTALLRWIFCNGAIRPVSMAGV